MKALPNRFFAEDGQERNCHWVGETELAELLDQNRWLKVVALKVLCLEPGREGK